MFLSRNKEVKWRSSFWQRRYFLRLRKERQWRLEALGIVKPPPRRWVRLGYKLPAPVRLPLFHGLLSLLILSLLPVHPLSMPTALGLAAGIVVLILLLARRGGYRIHPNG